MMMRARSARHPLTNARAAGRACALLAAALLLILPATLAAQSDSTQATVARTDVTKTRIAPTDTMALTLPGTATPRPWYDTLTVTQPHYARVTRLERLALSAFTTLAIPVSVVAGGLSTLPPAVNVVVENGTPLAGLTMSIGYGIGGDTTQLAYFPDFRIQAEYGYYFARSPRNRVALSMLVDRPIVSVHQRDFFWLGVAGGGGLATDFSTFYGPFAEGWIGLENPLGMRYITLFPMHNYGLRLRAGYDVVNARPWYEAAIAGSATFW